MHLLDIVKVQKIVPPSDDSMVKTLLLHVLFDDAVKHTAQRMTGIFAGRNAKKNPIFDNKIIFLILQCLKKI